MSYKLLEEDSIEKARKVMKSQPEANFIFLGYDDEKSRKVIEKLPIKILLLNLSERKDKQKQRNSGLNSVLAKILKKNGIFLGINLDELINSPDKPEIISRLKQNVVLCKKYKVQMKYVILDKKNKRNLINLKSLSLILGMPTWMTKKVELLEIFR